MGARRLLRRVGGASVGRASARREGAQSRGSDPALEIDGPLKRIAAVVVIGSFMTVMDTTIVNVALDTFGHRFHESIASVQWIVTSYLLALAALIPVSGWAARRCGSRRVYVVSLAVFTIGSLMCGLSGSLSQIVVFRVIQGVGGGIVFPVGLMIMAQAAGPERMGRMSSMIFVPAVVAPIVGPTLGGVLIQHLGWEWIFFVNVPFGVLGVAAGMRWLPRERALGEAGSLDMLGLVLLSVGMPALTFGISEIGISGRVGSARVIVPAIVGCVLTLLFIVRARRIPRPLLDLRLYSNRMFAAAVVLVFVLSAAFFGAYILMPLYFQEVRHDSVSLAGALVGPQGVGAAITMWWAGRRMDRRRVEWTILAGVLLMSLSAIVLARLTAGTATWVAPTAMFVRGLGVGLSMMPAMVIALAAVPAGSIADASPMLNVLQRLGASIGTAVIAVVLARASAGLPHRPTAGALASAYSTANWWAVGLTAVSVLPCLLLARVGALAPAREAARAEVEAGSAL